MTNNVSHIQSVLKGCCVDSYCLCSFVHLVFSSHFLIHLKSLTLPLLLSLVSQTNLLSLIFPCVSLLSFISSSPSSSSTVVLGHIPDTDCYGDIRLYTKVNSECFTGLMTTSFRRTSNCLIKGLVLIKK